jgi:hypothetical protein
MVPFPLHFADWVMRHFGQYMPEKVQQRDFLRIFEEMDRSIPMENPSRWISTRMISKEKPI